MASMPFILVASIGGYLFWISRSARRPDRP
jgi:hypothetical protein